MELGVALVVRVEDLGGSGFALVLVFIVLMVNLKSCGDRHALVRIM